MRHIPWVVLVVCALLYTSCFDPEPGEVSVRSTKNGRPQGCVVGVFNAKGNQISENATDTMGIGYIKDVAPGNYTLKFFDTKRKPYNIEMEVSVRPGESVVLDVELTESNMPADPGA